MAGDYLSTLRAAVYDRANIPENDPNFRTTTVDRFINAALRRASTTFDAFWLETSGTISTVAGTGDYTLLTNFTTFHKVSRVWLDSTTAGADYDLESRNKKDILDLRQYPQQLPMAYTVEEQKLKIAPLPDAVYTLQVVYIRLEDELTDESDQPLLPTQYSDWLVCQAAILAAIRKNDRDRLQFLKDEVKDWEKRIRDDIRQQKALPRIRLRDEGA